jgi:pimeloyl-ACP methyl ester carboxylesterase
VSGTPRPFRSGSARIEATVWPGRGDPAVLLHPGVCDRRVWRGVAERVAAAGHGVIAYDRRGFGLTTPGAGEPFSDLRDLWVVLRDAGHERAWLVGGSMGGRLAIDAALDRPARVTGLVLVAPAVSGEPDVDDAELDEATRALDGAIGAADEDGDLDEVNRLEAHLWLDGPGETEGRVAGPARELFLEMNGIALANGEQRTVAAASVAWPRLEELRLPVTVAWGELDVPVVRQRSATVARRVPGAAAVVLPGVAHLPMLEQPDAVADVVLAAMAR